MPRPTLALTSNPKRNREFDAECISCHTTGFPYKSGFVSAEATPFLKGNQCENCHGPGSLHNADPDNMAYRKPMTLTRRGGRRRRFLRQVPRRRQRPPLQLRHLLPPDLPQGSRRVRRPQGPPAPEGREGRRGRGMTGPTLPTEGTLAMTEAATPQPARASRLDGFVGKYRQDHTHPVNHFLHLGVGWPMCAVAVILLPFRPLWSPGPGGGRLRLHVRRPLPLRGEQADDPQASHDPVRHGLGGRSGGSPSAASPRTGASGAR